jgi:hypothetical protein
VRPLQATFEEMRFISSMVLAGASLRRTSAGLTLAIEPT